MYFETRKTGYIIGKRKLRNKYYDLWSNVFARTNVQYEYLAAQLGLDHDLDFVFHYNVAWINMAWDDTFRQI